MRIYLNKNGFTESLNGCGWKEPLETTQSNSSVKAHSPGAGCTGLHPRRFWIYPEIKTPQALWAASSSALACSNKLFFHIHMELPVCHFLPNDLSLDATKKSLAISSWHPSSRCFTESQGILNWKKSPRITKSNSQTHQSLALLAPCSNHLSSF